MFRGRQVMKKKYSGTTESLRILRPPIKKRCSGSRRAGSKKVLQCRLPVRRVSPNIGQIRPIAALGGTGLCSRIHTAVKRRHLTRS